MEFFFNKRSLTLCIEIYLAGTASVVDPNKLNLDPDRDQGFWPNLDPDPGLCYQF